MENINIIIEKSSRKVNLFKSVIGNDGENLQENFIFSFSDEFVDGQGRLELILPDKTKTYIILDKVNQTYQIPVLSVITHTGRVKMQLVITEGVDENSIPIFKSNVFYVVVNNSINYVGNEPEGYDDWMEVANTKLNQMDNFDIDVNKTGSVATVTITDRTGTSKSVEIHDGEDGAQGIQGPEGPAGQDGADATINGVNTLNIEAGENITISQSGSTLTINSTGGGAVSSVNGQTGDVVINIPDVSNFITKDVNNLTYYELKTATGNSIAMSIDSSTYVLTVSLKNSAGTILNTQTVDLPLETMVVGGSYDSTNKKIILTLKNGQTVEFSVADLVSGLQTEITSSNKLSADLVDDTNATNKFTNATEKSTWNGKYDKPSGGIPSTDLAETYVKPTDYATSSTGGVIKASWNSGQYMNDGNLQARTITYQEYQDASNSFFIGKATLDNVLNARIGDIDSALDSINGEVVS